MTTDAIFTLIAAIGGSGAVAAIVQGIFNRRQISANADSLIGKSETDRLTATLVELGEVRKELHIANSRIIRIGKSLDEHRKWDYAMMDKLSKLGITDIEMPPSLWIDYQ